MTDELRRRDDEAAPTHRMAQEALRKTGIEVIGDVPWGTHFCQFYKTKEDLIDLLVPYFKEGLAQNEFCMWVTSEPLTEVEATNALRKAVPDLDRCLAQGQLEIIPYTDWYRKDGTFDADRVLDGWVDKLDHAITRGFEGLRLTGNTFWLESNEWQAFTDYEEKVTRVIGQFRMVALCTYSLDKCGASEVIDVVSNHQFALSKREGRWARIQSSEQRRVETALRESEERFRSTFEHAAVGIAHVAPSGRWLRVNRTLCELVGYGSDELLAKTFQDITHPDDLQSDLDHVRRMLAGEIATYSMEKRYIRKGGAVVWINLTVALIRDPEGNPDYFISVVEDISARKRVEEELRRLTAELEQRVVERTAQLQVTVRNLEQEIAERTRAEEALRKSEARQALILHSLPVILYTARPFGDYGGTWVSDNIEQVTGFSPARFIEEPALWKSRLHPDDWQAAAEGMRVAVEQGVSSAEYRWQCADGRYRWFLDRTVLVRNADGTANELIGIWLDITERKQSEVLLQAARDFYLKLLDDFPTPVWRAGLDAKCNWFNKTWLALTGRTLEQELGDGWVEGVHPDDRDRCVRDYLEAFEARRPFEMEYRLRRHDGEYRWLTDVGRPFNDLDGTFAGYVGSCYDFTERKRGEEEVRRLQHFLNSIVENLPDMVFVKDARDLRFLLLNKAGEALIGCSHEELIGKCDHDFFPKEQADFFAAKDRDVLAGGRLLDIPEELIQTRDKGQRILHTKKIPILDEQGVPRYLLGLSQDITDRKQVEEQLRLVTSALEAAANGVVITDTEGTIQWVNPAFTALTGYRAEDAIGQNPRLLKSGQQDRPFYERLWNTIKTKGMEWCGEVVNKRKDGSLYTEEMTITPVRNDQGAISHFIAIKQNVSLRKQMEAHAIRLERLAAIGQLLGGLAHELRNPLFILTGHLQLFREKLLQQEYATLPADLERIESAAGRMSRITERFLTLAQPSQPRLEPCAVPTALMQTLEFLGNELMKSQIQVDPAIAPDLPLVLADPKQLQEVFLNLMVNAMQAMVAAHGKGMLRVSAALAASPRLPVSASADTGHGDTGTRGQGEGEQWIEVRIQDDGPGIPPEHRDKLFEPFFTTKPPQEGTGLGLWAVRTTVMALGGTVACESEVGRGATFIVRLPVVENSGQPSAISHQP